MTFLEEFSVIHQQKTTTKTQTQHEIDLGIICAAG